MWQRFSERARKVVFYAQEEAQYYGDGYVSTEHLLLGLMREKDSLAIRILENLEVDPTKLEQDVRSQLPKGDARPNQDMTLTPRAKRVIDCAYDEARNLNNNYIGTEHLLLGLLREHDGLAGRVLESNGVSLEQTRKTTMDMQDPERNVEFISKPNPHKPQDWLYQMTMMRVKEWATWGNQIGVGEFPIVDEIADLRSTLENSVSAMERNLLLALCLEISEGGSLEESENWKKLRLTKDQADAMAQIGAELRKLMES